MHKFKWIGYCFGVGTIFFALFLLFGQFALSGNAHARTQSDPEADGSLAVESDQREIVVSLAHQWMHVYQGGQEIYNTPVTTGAPDLPTPQGTYHIFYKAGPTIFHSPFPRTSKNWYPPVRVQYAMEWKTGGYFIHDSWWHSIYGPGTNVSHYDPTYGWQSGSHGCIAVPLPAAKWLYSWTTIGTTVRVVN
jgi:lipoprotein-anchoring transpeptidase ErfK/SrfK